MGGYFEFGVDEKSLGQVVCALTIFVGFPAAELFSVYLVAAG